MNRITVCRAPCMLDQIRLVVLPLLWDYRPLTLRGLPPNVRFNRNLDIYILCWVVLAAKEVLIITILPYCIELEHWLIGLVDDGVTSKPSNPWRWGFFCPWIYVTRGTTVNMICNEAIIKVGELDEDYSDDLNIIGLLIPTAVEPVKEPTS